jgi:hypothetical protein
LDGVDAPVVRWRLRVDPNQGWLPTRCPTRCRGRRIRMRRGRVAAEPRGVKGRPHVVPALWQEIRDG